jgi:radical SAM protein with 4Fe4S-binding SPASM domain
VSDAKERTAGRWALGTLREKMVYRRIPAFVSIELTHRCNLRCVHCYLGGEDACPAPERPELPTERWLTLVDEIAAAGCLELLITGGEPLLRRDFAQIYRRAREAGMLLTVFTNGTLIDESILALFCDLPPNHVEISIYGATEGTYEAVTGVPGSHRRCLEGIRSLLECGINACLKTVILELNKHEIREMERMARSLGIDFRTDSSVFPRFDGDRRPLDYRVPAAEAVEVEFGDHERACAWSDYYEKTLGQPEQEKLYTCGAGLTYGNVTPSGELTPCLMIPEPAEQIRTQSFTVAWRASISSIREVEPEADYRCNSCPKRHLCGLCPAFFALESGSDQRPADYICELGEARLRRVRAGKGGKLVV